MNLKKLFEEIGKRIGEEVVVDGLVKKTGRLRRNAASAEDVLGFDYIVHWENACFEFYKANPPLKGVTEPVPVPCPVGLAVFDEYKIDYPEAIEIFHTINCGSEFIHIFLCKPLHSKVTDPCWYFVSNLGVRVVIDANTGKVLLPRE